MRLPTYWDSPAAVEALTRDGWRHLRLGNLREAEYVLHRAAGVADQLVASPDVPLIRLHARQALAAAYRALGRFEESESLLRRTLAKAEAELGPDAPALAELRAGVVPFADTAVVGEDPVLAC